MTTAMAKGFCTTTPTPRVSRGAPCRERPARASVGTRHPVRTLRVRTLNARLLKVELSRTFGYWGDIRGNGRKPGKFEEVGGRNPGSSGARTPAASGLSWDSPAAWPGARAAIRGAPGVRPSVPVPGMCVGIMHNIHNRCLATLGRCRRYRRYRRCKRCERCQCWGHAES